MDEDEDHLTQRRLLKEIRDDLEDIMATLADIQTNLDALNAAIATLTTEEGSETVLGPGQIAVDQATVDQLNTEVANATTNVAALVPAAPAEAAPPAADAAPPA